MIHSGRTTVGQSGVNVYSGPEVSYKGQPFVVYNHTGFVALLPYIEQDNLYKMYNYQNVFSSAEGNATTWPIGPDPTPNPNRLVAQNRIKTYVCPADNFGPDPITGTGAN